MSVPLNPDPYHYHQLPCQNGFPLSRLESREVGHRPIMHRGTWWGKSCRHKAAPGPEGSGASLHAVIYPNPARGEEGGSDGMRHLAALALWESGVSPPARRPAGLPFSKGRKGTIAIQGLPGSRPPQIRAV